MILSYEVAFDSGFDFVKGGKLPGLCTCFEHPTTVVWVLSAD